MNIVALDIGGANLKGVDSTGQAQSRPFALWRAPDALAEALAEFLGNFVVPDTLLVTTTGELCDCFSTKAAGVQHILDAVEVAAGPRPGVQVWLITGEWLPLAQARRYPERVAAANWLAVATLAARLSPPGSSILLDIGSTTTDVVPITGGRPVPRGRTDTERLLCGELVYTGIRRTAIASLTATLPYGGKACPVAAETFATTLDAYLLTGDVPEASEDSAQPRSPDTENSKNFDNPGTADGRPATVECARQRLARMVCADADDLAHVDSYNAARQIVAAQEKRITAAVRKVADQFHETPSLIVTAGSGEFLARRVAARMGFATLSLADRIGPTNSTCACAYAMCELYDAGVLTTRQPSTE